MKYLRPLIAILFLTALTSPFGFGQFVRVWQDTAGTSGPFWWLQKADNNATSLAYNPSTGHLLVSRRNDRIYVLDATNGNLLDSLSNAGTSGSFRFNTIRATSDGVIYALSLVTAASSSFTIYRWANETATPTQAVVTYVSARTGDSFGLSGSGTGTVLYCSGTGSTKIYVFATSDGVSFSKTDSITITSGEARGAISPVTTGIGSDLWIDGAGTPTRKINSTGTTLVTPASTTSAGLPTDSINTGWHRVQYFQQGANKFLALVGRNEATNGKITPVYNITMSETNPTLFGYTQLSNVYNTNLNATGDVAVRGNVDGTITVFQLVTNNGLAAFITNRPVSVGTNQTLPTHFVLEQNYPNPFNPSTTIRYDLPIATRISLKVFDVLGREVRTLVDDFKTAGSFTVTWDGTDNTGLRMPSGAYFYALKAEGIARTKRMILMQ